MAARSYPFKPSVLPSSHCSPHSPKDASQPGTRQPTPLRPQALGGYAATDAALAAGARRMWAIFPPNSSLAATLMLEVASREQRVLTRGSEFAGDEGWEPGEPWKKNADRGYCISMVCGVLRYRRSYCFTTFHDGRHHGIWKTCIPTATRSRRSFSMAATECSYSLSFRDL